MMTDKLFLHCRTYLCLPRTTGPNRCDLKSKAGRCSGADLGFWDIFTSVLDTTFKREAEVTSALRALFSMLPSEALPAVVEDGVLSQHRGLREQTMAAANTLTRLRA